MVFMSAEERAQARTFSELAVRNPFVPERVELERRAFGSSSRRPKLAQKIRRSAAPPHSPG